MRYDAVAFLESLFELPTGGNEGNQQETDPAIAPADLPADWHLAWDERAAIMEYDGGLPRERAESLALAEIIRAMVGQVPQKPCRFRLRRRHESSADD